MGFFGKKKESASRLSLDALALDYIDEGVIILGPDGNIQLINPAGRKILGQPNDAPIVGVGFSSAAKLVDSLGRPVQELLNPVEIAMKSRESSTVRTLSVLPVGGIKPIPVELGMRVARDAMIITMRDITRELKEDEERNDFISTASHEMRTPVASIEGFLALAINPQTATIDERARGYLEQAHIASQHLGKLFQDLLDTTGLDDGRMVPRLEPKEIIATVRTIADTMAVVVAEKGLTYIFDSGEIEGAKVVNPVIYTMVDVDFLGEIIGNLIDNATKYTDEGEVRVTVRGEEENVVIGVSDTGIGIGPADLPHIFQKFYRADNSDTRTTEGTGLGLYIVKKKVEVMGGRIWAESKLGEGTSFYFTFPRLSSSEYERRKLALENQGKMVANKV